ncbi:MAG: hypothetical protein MI802_16660 [Desulfobacterales bacterium]|nr:hypothetical protein [Desulfobacterales bacterium]
MADIVPPLVLITYCGDNSEPGAKILNLGRELLPENAVTACRTLRELSEALKQAGTKLVLIAVKDGEELEEIISLKDWLDGQPIVMILPEEQTEKAPRLMTRALRLYPKYISNSRRFTDVTLVLKKIIHNHNHGGTL